MLTASEKKWLKERKIRYARNHLYHRNAFYIWPGYSNHDKIRDLKDALEFSERVTAKLAKATQCIGNPYLYRCIEDREVDCEWCRLKQARLAVEEEMENELARMS